MHSVGYLGLSLLLALLVSACSRQPEYLQANSLPPIVVPEGAAKERLGQLYPVPPSAVAVAHEFNVPFPPTVPAQGEVNNASLETTNDQFHLLNARPPATTWSQLLRFLQQQSIPLADQNVAAATITSDWFTRALQPGFAIRYRLRLERGLQPDTTEIYVASQLQSSSQPPLATNDWPDSLQDIPHANWLVSQLLEVLNNPRDSVGDSYLATTIALPVKVRVTGVEGEPVLSVKVSARRLSAALTKALTDTDWFTYAAVTRPDTREYGVIHFNQRRVKEKKSRWYNPFSWGGSGSSAQNSRYSLEQILANLPNEPQVNALFADYKSRRQPVDQKRLKLSGIKGYLLVQQPVSDNEQRIYIRDAYGRRLNLEEVRGLLDTLRLWLI